MKNNSLIEGNILKSLLKFAVPVFAALFLQAMYGAVDLLVVGRFAEVADLSGVSTGSMFMTSFANVITGLSVGLTVVVAEAIGKGVYERVGKGVGTGIALFGIIAVAATVCLVIFAEPLAVLMNAPEDALNQTADYLRICGAGTVFIIAYNVLGAVFRGLGDSKTPLITVSVACIINVGCDLLFVIVFGMGAAGAASATVLAQAVSVLVSVFIIRRRKHNFSLSLRDVRLSASYVKKILLIGSPVALQDLLVGISFIFIQSTVNILGSVESAAIGVGEKVCAFLMLAASAFMQAMTAFVAQNNGACRHERSKKALKFGIIAAFISGLCMGLLAFFAGDYLAAIFSKEAAVIAASHEYLKAYAFDCLLTAILFCFIGYFNGCEHTMFVMIQGIVGAFLVRIPLVALFFNISGGSLFVIGLATPITSVVQIIMCLAAYYIYEKKKGGRSKIRQISVE